MVRKSRSVIGPLAVGYNDGVVAGTTQLPGGNEVIDTVSHNLRYLGSHDVGGPMLLARDVYKYSLGHVIGGKFDGSDVVISGVFGQQNQPAVESDASLIVKGTTALARSWPNNPSFSAVTSMSELYRDGVPSPSGIATWRNRTNIARSAGDEYLNVAFGWMPLVNDMRNFAKTVKNHNQILQDFKKGSGNTTRMSYHFPSTEYFNIANGNVLIYRAGNNGISSSRPGSVCQIQRTETWFKGAMKFHLPADGSQLGKAQLYANYADRLLGIDPTPSNVWNASPWTWAFDWITNAGDVMTNISQLGQDGTVLLYGYIMKYALTEERLLVAAGTSGFTGETTACERTRTRESKKRLPSTPYGFGVLETSFSTKQKAVISALGLSHIRGGPG